MVSGVTDHITPWKACYRSVHLYGGETEFILSNAGHLQSLVNPPGNPKAQYFTNSEYPATANEWMENTETTNESWWLRWNSWLSERSGIMKNAPKKLGNKNYPPLSMAPGEYVFT